MKINKERTGCGLSVRTELSPAVLKEKMNHTAEFMNNVFVPSDVTWEGERYLFYIGHRQSLKEYIYENGIKTEDFIMLIHKIRELFTKALEHGISPYEFIFDYECIFVGSSIADMEFIYAPDADVYKDGLLVYNKCSDLAALVSLHIEYGTSEQAERKETAVTEVLHILSDWENELPVENYIFPQVQIAPLLEQLGNGKIYQRFTSSWYLFAISECSAVCIMIVWLITHSGEKINAFLAAAWLFLMICVGYLLAPERKTDDHNKKEKTYKYIMGNIHKKIEEIKRFHRKTTSWKEVCKMELNGDMLLKGLKYTVNEEDKEIHIGRDDNWADVPIGLTFVSRKHATLYKQDDKWYIKDLKSTNGTFVNGAKIMPDQPLSLKNGSEISLGIPETKFIFCLP
ncbi:MAG: FHA domain-containing protein [Clostridiales bacterium]|nr:FHA domain-containing protein [Clostridiales bacterium]